MRTRSDIIGLLEQNRKTIKNFGVKELGVFGSFAREEQTAVSDVDVLVELEQRLSTSIWTFFSFLKICLEARSISL